MSTQTVETGVPLDTFELRLRIARFHAGDLSAEEAGERVGVSGQTWRNWEAGHYTNAARKPAMLAFIANKLNVREEWLRDGGPLTACPAPDGGTTIRRRRARQGSNLRPTAYSSPRWRRPRLAVSRPVFTVT